MRSGRILETGETLTPEQVTDRLYYTAKNKAGSRELSFHLIKKDLFLQVLQGSCPYTGLPYDMRESRTMPLRASLDRIDNLVGYVPDNVAVVSKIWNQAKYIWDVETVDNFCIARCKQLGLLKEGSYEPDDDTKAIYTKRKRSSA